MFFTVVIEYSVPGDGSKILQYAYGQAQLYEVIMVINVLVKYICDLAEPVVERILMYVQEIADTADISVKLPVAAKRVQVIRFMRFIIFNKLQQRRIAEMADACIIIIKYT